MVVLQSSPIGLAPVDSGFCTSSCVRSPLDKEKIPDVTRCENRPDVSSAEPCEPPGQAQWGRAFNSSVALAAIGLRLKRRFDGPAGLLCRDRRCDGNAVFERTWAADSLLRDGLLRRDFMIVTPFRTTSDRTIRGSL